MNALPNEPGWRVKPAMTCTPPPDRHHASCVTAGLTRSPGWLHGCSPTTPMRLYLGGSGHFAGMAGQARHDVYVRMPALGCLPSAFLMRASGPSNSQLATTVRGPCFAEATTRRPCRKPCHARSPNVIK